MAAVALRRVLLVEDDPDVSLVASVALRGLGGLEVEVCGSARDALERAAAFAPDLILMDVMMPGMDGVSALDALRREPATSGMPVVFMTAKVQPHEVARYRELGCLDVIPKPFEPTTLHERLQEIWRRRDD